MQLCKLSGEPKSKYDNERYYKKTIDLCRLLSRPLMFVPK
jgi:hypothetical protein